eukprot:TRINITY_DN9989_c0_g1_i1.p1 TRINITY_DN9989_c0_g1~~TRINITY_DN9989_c0_g1_i1.p1  ORF type:complete len:217 (-),score=78.44 TRINITY_DN9989_c0_g1_i1:436-1086(-)
MWIKRNWPAIAITLCGVLATIGLLAAIVLPWYVFKTSPPNADCTVSVARHVFYQFVLCGKCSDAECALVAPAGEGIDVNYVLLVSSVTWVATIVALLFTVLGVALAWVRQFGGKMRWLARLLLLLGFFFNIAAFLSYLAINAAIAEDSADNGLKCDTGPCKDFVGHDYQGLEYWGPASGWICNVCVGLFTLLALILSLMLRGPRKFEDEYASIYSE